MVRAQQHGERAAVVDSQGSFTYDDLLAASERVATALIGGYTDLRQNDLQEERVAFLLTPGFPWVAVQWGIWRAGGVAVPLPLNSANPELEFFIDDTQASTVVFDAHAASTLAPIAAARGIRARSYDQLLAHQLAEMPNLISDAAPDIATDRRAMILYTSGTSSRPKGVVTTHANICSADRDPGGSLGVVGRRSHPAVFASAPRSRNRQRGFLCALVGRDLPDAAALRRECRVGLHREPQHNALHGRAHNLRQAHRRLGRRFAGAPRRTEPGVREVAVDGLWLSGPARGNTAPVEGNQRPYIA